MNTNKLTIISTLLVLLILNLPSASAINNLAVSPQNLWYGIEDNDWEGSSAIYITAECNHSQDSEIIANLKKSGTIKPLVLTSTATPNPYYAVLTTNIIDFIYDEYNSGIYTISAPCGNDTIRTTFTIHNLDGTVEKISAYTAESQSPIYLGDTFLETHDTLKVYVRIYDTVDYDNRPIHLEDLSFVQVTFQENPNIAFSNPAFMESDACDNCLVLQLDDLNDKGISKDTEYTLKIDVKYIIDGSAKTFSFTAKRTLIFGNVPDDTPEETPPEEQSITTTHYSDILMTGESTTATTLNIQPQNIDNFTIDKDNIRAKLYQSNSKIKDLEVSSVTRNGNDWTITVNKIPTLDQDKSYNIRLTVTYNSITETETILIHHGINFEGVMKDSSGVVVPATIEFEGPVYEKISIGGDGRYKAMLTSGIYELIITYPSFSSTIPLVVNINGVEINKESIGMAPDPIKFSHYSKNVNLHDMAVADLIDFQFALPHESATIKMPYDESKIYDDREIEVFVCSNWNCERKDCVGKWTRVEDVAINTINNFISFKPSQLSAFVISGKETLSLEIELFPDTYFSKEEILISGRVVNTNDNPVKDVDVNYVIKKTDISGTIKTDVSGTFEASFNAPVQEGKYELIFGAQKEPYHSSGNQSFYLNIEKKKEVTLILPEVSYVVLDDASQSNIKFKVKNTGQAHLTNIRFSVSAQGLSRDKYSVDPSLIDKLEPGKEAEISIKIPLTAEYCQKMGCMTVYSFLIETSAEQLDESKSASLVVEVKTEGDASVPVADTSENQVVDTEDAKNESALKSILESLAGIAGISESSPAEITGLATGTTTSSLNTYMILATIILCFVIIALKRRRQKTPSAGSRRTLTSSFDIIKRHIKRT